jgi:antitoxin component YwqK of YwqJK toxin-antitoxin module
MKNYLIISLLFLSLGFSQKEYDVNHIFRMDNGLYTEEFSGKTISRLPITGKIYGYYGEAQSAKKLYLGNLLNGKREGSIKSYYHSNRGKKSDYYFKNNKKDGLSTYWYENGQKKTEQTYKNDIEDGLFTFWSEDGKKEMEETYKDGKLISSKEWNRDGSVKD